MAISDSVRKKIEDAKKGNAPSTTTPTSTISPSVSNMIQKAKAETPQGLIVKPVEYDPNVVAQGKEMYEADNPNRNKYTFKDAIADSPLEALYHSVFGKKDAMTSNLSESELNEFYTRYSKNAEDAMNYGYSVAQYNDQKNREQTLKDLGLVRNDWLKDKDKAEAISKDVVKTTANLGAAVLSVRDAGKMLGDYATNGGEFSNDTKYGLNTPFVTQKQQFQSDVIGDINKATEGTWTDFSDDSFLKRRLGIDNMASWLYSMGYSAAESTVLMGTMGPVGTIMLGTSAGAMATMEALQEGKDSNKALATGIINGTVEWATERFITLEWILKSKNLSKLEGKELVKTWLMNELKSAGAEGSEELASGVIDYIADALINQDDSEFAKAKAEFLAAGYNDKDATQKAIKSKIPEIVSDTLSGALSGALMNGVGGAVKNAAVNSEYARSIAWSQRNGTYQDLINNINAVEGTTGKLTTDSKTRDVIKDYRRGTENMSVAAIKEQLESKGVLTNISEKTAQAIFDKANDYALSPEQKRLLKTAEAQRVLNEFSGGEAEWVQTTQAAQNAFASPIASKYKGETENGSQTAVEDDTASEKVAEYKAKANVETDNEVSGEEILASSAKALNLSNEEVTAGYNVRSDVTPQAYANALELSKAYGRAGMSLADLAKKGVAVDSLMSKVYNESNREFVKNLKDNRKRINASNKTTKYMTSEEVANAGVNAVDMDSLSAEKKAALDSWGEFINKVFGLDVHYFDGTGIDKNGWYNGNGIYIDINAEYNMRVSDATHLGDIKGATAHELVHSMKESSPELYLELRKFITEYYFGKDENRLNREVESKINSYKNHGIELNEETAIEEIIADSCAKVFDDENAIRKMANQNKSLAQKIVDWLNGIINKIKSLVSSGRSNEYAEFLDTDALENVRDIFARYAGEIQSNTEVGNNLDVTDAKLENKTIKSEVADILKKTNGDITDLPLGGTMAEGENTPKKASIKESIAAAGFTTDIVERNGLRMLQVTAPDGTIITPETSVGTIGDIIKNANSPLNMLVERAATTLNTLDDKTIEGIQDIYSQFIHTAVTYGNDETMGKEKLDSIWKWAGTKQFRSIKPNSDNQYGVSADLLTICKKTEQLLDAISDYQVRNKRGATPGEVMRLYYHTGEKGYQTPCPFCYVFSHWIRMGLLFETAASAEETYAGHLDNRGINDLDFWRKEWVKQKKWAKDNEKLIAKAKQDTQDIPDIIDSFSEVYAKALADVQNNAKTDAEHKKASKIAKEIEGIVKTLNERYVTAFNLVSSSDYAGWISSCILNIPSQSNVTVPDGATNEEGWMAQANAATAYGDYKKVDQDVLFDLRRVDELVRDYPAMARFRTSKGSAGGKAVENYADNAFGEVVAGVATDGSRTANNALMESFDSGDTRCIDNQLKSASQKAKKQLLRGGNRVFSWSDNRVDTGIDMLINFIQFQAMGAGIQAYTKQLEGLELISSMNGYVNGSLIAKGVGYREVNGHRELVFSDVQGINHETTFELNRRYDKAGNILVGMNDIHIETALADDRIFFVIPWHRSGLSNHLLFKMMEMLGERYVAESDTKDGATDYTSYQEEEFFSDKLNGTGIESRVVPIAMTQIWRDAEKMRVGNLTASDIAGYDYIEVENGRLSDSQIEYRKLRAKVMSGESLTFEEEVRVNGDYYLSRLKSSMEENGIDSWSGTDIDSIYPYEYWDYNSTYSTADVNGLLYLEYCRRLGIQPKFCGLNAKHQETQHGDFRNLHGYWKLLIDRRMYDTKGRYQHLAPVNILGTNKSTVPGFSMDLVTPEGLEAREAEYKAIGLDYSVTRAADTEGAKIVSDATMEDMSKYAELHRDIDADKAKAQYAEMSNRKNLAEYFDNEKAYLRSTKEKYAKELGVEEKASAMPAKFSVKVADKDTLNWLNTQEKEGKVIRTYKAVETVTNEDGTIDLYPPMATYRKVGKGRDAQYIKANPGRLGVWQMSEEHPEDILVDKDGKEKYPLYKKVINPKTGKPKWSQVNAAYDPYEHSSNLAINDQFKLAYARPNVKVVECLICVEDVNSGYQADRAKLAVGRHPWKAGDVMSELRKQKDINRDVYLTQYLKPIRILDDAEVAEKIHSYLDGTDVEMPYEVVTPGVRENLEKLGTKIKYSVKELNPPTRKSGSMFSGGGLIEQGLGYELLDKQFGVEYNSKIAAVYRNNYGHQIFAGEDNGNVIKFNSDRVKDLWALHCSPVCHDFSNQKQRRKITPEELKLDMDAAKAVARHIKAGNDGDLKVFTLENAPGYKNSEMLKVITDQLDNMGWKWDVDVYNSADYGSATSRRRCLLRAVKDGELPAKPQKIGTDKTWDSVTRDLWDSFRVMPFAPNQLDAIANTPGLDVRNNDKAILCLGTTNGHTMVWAEEGELSPTLTTKISDARLVLPGGKVVKPSVQFFGRIMGMPDSYKYPTKATRNETVGYTIVGNGVPVELTKAVIGGLYESKYQQETGKQMYSIKEDPATFKGKPFWSGAVNLADGTIEETHSISEARKSEFHHSLYFSENAVDKIDDGEWGFFWIDESGKVNGDWREDIPRSMLDKIKKQIKFDKFSLKDSDGIIVDFDEPGGDTVYSKSYRKGVDTRTVLRDIDNYFKNGKPSMVAEFHNSYSIKDSEYLELAKDPRKNDAELRKMVEEAARDAGYTVRAYHGTPNSTYNQDYKQAVKDAYSFLNPDKEYDESKFGRIAYALSDYRVQKLLPENLARRLRRGSEIPFTVFDDSYLGLSTKAPDAKKGHYFSPNREFAAEFMNTYEVNPYTGEKTQTNHGRSYLLEVFIKPGKTLDLTHERSADISKDKSVRADMSEYDTIINKVHNGRNRGKVETEIIVKNPENIKSADPVTYDDNGNVIPLSERFKSDNNDIRYSLKSEIDPRMYLASALLDNIKNAEDRKTLEEYKATYNERKGLYRQLDGLKADLETATDPEKVKADMSKVRKQIRTLEDKLNSVMTMPRMQSIIKEQREDIERYRWALLEQGEKADKERARLEKKLGTYADEIRRRMEKEKQMRSDFKEQKGVAYYRPRVEKLVKELTINLKKTPEIFRKPFKGFLESLELETRDVNGVVKATASNWNKDQLYKAILKLSTTDLDAKAWLENYGVDLNPEMVTWIQQVKDSLEMTNLGFNTVRTSESSAEELALIHKILKSLNTTVKMLSRSYTNKAIDMTAIAQETEDYLRTVPRNNSTVNPVTNLLVWKNAQPVTVFDRFGEGGKKVFDLLKKGQDKAARNDQIIADFLVDENGNRKWSKAEARKWSTETVNVELENDTVDMTPAQMMTFVCVARDPDGYRHLVEGGGFKLAHRVGLKGKLTVDTARRITEGDVETIARKLNEYDPRLTKLAKEIQDFMGTQGAEWGNQVSIARYGYEQFGIENYFPLHTVAAEKVGNIIANADAENSLFGMLNKSFTKERTFRANNAIVLDNIFDVFSDHMSKMSAYNAFALPILDTIRWMKFSNKSQDANGKPVLRTLGDAMQSAFGDGVAVNYIKDLLLSLNGKSGAEDNDIFLKGLRLRNRVAVAANIRVAIQQPFSIVRAFDVIEPKYFSAPSDFKGTYNEMLENSGIALWKSQGHYDIDIKNTLLTETKGGMNAYADFVGDFSEKSMALAEMGDNLTWTLLWNASKNKVKAENPGLAGEEFLKKVNDTFEDIIYRTQVVDSPLTKSHWMRNKDFMHRATASFKSEPTTTYNTLLRQFDKIVATKRSGGDWASVKKGVVKATTVFAAQAIVNAIVTSIIDTMRDDDDYETLWEKFKDAIVGDGSLKGWMSSNLGDNTNPFASLPWLSDIFSYFEGYTPDRADLTALQSLLDIGKRIASAIESKNWDYKTTTKLFDAASQLSGIPFNNMMRDIESVWNTTVGRMYPEYKLQRTPELASAGYKALYKAMTDGNSVRVSEIIDELASNNISNKTAYTGVTTQIRNAYRDGKISSDDAIEYMMLINGYFEQEKDRKHIEKQVAGW